MAPTSEDTVLHETAFPLKRWGRAEKGRLRADTVSAVPRAPRTPELLVCTLGLLKMSLPAACPCIS